MKYQTIYIDPPWNEKGGGKIKRGADRHYKTMTTRQITALNIPSLAFFNCHLYMWATNNYLPDALSVMSAWGFRYITTITWAKDKFGLGQYYRGQTEHCLFGVQGKLPYKVKDGKRQQGVTLLEAPRGKHSEKPGQMREMIERVSYSPYLEIFARKEVDGWDVIGDEIDGRSVEDIIGVIKL